MAKEEPERLPRPELPPPVQGGGKIKVVIVGKPQVTSTNPNVQIERKGS